MPFYGRGEDPRYAAPQIMISAVTLINDHIRNEPSRTYQRLEKGTHIRIWKYCVDGCPEPLAIMPLWSKLGDFKSVKVMAQVRIDPQKTGIPGADLVERMNDLNNGPEVWYSPDQLLMLGKRGEKSDCAYIETQTNGFRKNDEVAEDHDSSQLFERRVELLTEMYTANLRDLIRCLDHAFLSYKRKKKRR